MQSFSRRKGGLVGIGLLLAFVSLTIAIMPAVTLPSVRTTGIQRQPVGLKTNFISPAGVCLKNVSYRLGDRIRVSSIVSNLPRNPDLSPIDPRSIQGFLDGVGGQVLLWDVATNGYNFVIDFGAANESSIGIHMVYTKVILFDGSVITSEPIIMHVTASLPTNTFCDTIKFRGP